MEKRKSSKKRRIIYLLNEHISKGIKQQFFMLLIFICIIILLFAALSVSLKAVTGMTEGIWQSFIHLLDPGTVSGNDFSNTPLLILMVIVTLIGMTFTGLLISIINNALEEKLSDLRLGKAPIVEQNHMVIFGCNENTFTVLEEQIEANLNIPKHLKNPKNGTIVIVDTCSKEEIENTISAHIDDFHHTNIICRSGNMTQSSFLSTIALENANSIIFCTNDDTLTFNTILAVGNYLKGFADSNPIIVAQFEDKTIQTAANTALEKYHPILIHNEGILSRITAQVCRQPGLSHVLQDLFNYQGNEIYIESKDRDNNLLYFEGEKFGDVLLKFTNATVIGIRRPKTDGTGADIYLVPSRDFVIQKGDEFIHIAEDDRMIVCGDSVTNDYIDTIKKPPTPLRGKKINLVILEWNKRLPKILENLDDFVASGSIAIVISARLFESTKKYKNITVQSILNSDLENPVFLKKLHLENTTNILLLNNDSISHEEADTNTMMQLLHIRKLLKKQEEREEKSNIILTSELFYPEHQRLMSVAEVNDFIVGSEFTNRVITQLANQPELDIVFKELLKAEGREIYLRPVENYIDISQNLSVSFADLTKICFESNDIVIGWMTYDNSGKLVRTLNPLKSDSHTFLPGEELIVLSEGL